MRRCSVSDGREPGDLIGSEDPALQMTVDMEAVSSHWNELPPAEQQVLLLRYYGNMTQAQVAERLSCSQMQISRIADTGPGLPAPAPAGRLAIGGYVLEACS